MRPLRRLSEDCGKGVQHARVPTSTLIHMLDRRTHRRGGRIRRRRKHETGLYPPLRTAASIDQTRNSKLETACPAHAVIPCGLSRLSAPFLAKAQWPCPRPGWLRNRHCAWGSFTRHSEQCFDLSFASLQHWRPADRRMASRHLKQLSEFDEVVVLIAPRADDPSSWSVLTRRFGIPR